ncbi:GNAT family N-acetyltransferase [Mucilaginibacter roseus]|uniref:GNAT family N-acetyltransferase n=1 Tax=Mucilaginibacter roseus TaxID=1528868 RepID=A0ABS8U327_9SPHI|nr:GNAT family N-acetyltransferase [Mucilaginibacter roseus]MCD8741523.1 GNAT family N-acetyltransferase [Mucilaginibacter roseus]
MDLDIRQANLKDLHAICDLFYNTIHAVNSKDYDASQIKVWSANRENDELWRKRLSTQYFIVAVHSEQIVGFSSVATNGYLDLMFVHQHYQGKGIATGLLAEIERYVIDNLSEKTLTTHASITAQPFFLKKGFKMIKQQTVKVQGTGLINFVMQKELK